MSPERAIHEFRCLTIEMSHFLEMVDHARVPFVIDQANRLMALTENFRNNTTMAQIKQWEADRFQERGWSKSPIYENERLQPESSPEDTKPDSL